MFLTAYQQVRKESKDKTLPDWMAWANALRDSLKGLHEYVKVRLLLISIRQGASTLHLSVYFSSQRF